MTAASTPIEDTSAAQRSASGFVIATGRIILALVLLLVWEAGARHLGRLFLAPPSDVALRILERTRSGAIFADIYVTLSVSLIGFLIGCFFGILLPMILRRLPRLTEALDPFIVAAMGVPKFALAPLLILWFGIGAAPKLVIVSFMVFFVIFVTVFAGIRSVDRRLVDMARVLGADQMTISRKIIWRSLTPFFFAGLKIALPRAVSAALVGEFLVGSEGLGHYIEQSRQTSDTTGVFAGIVVATLLVLAINLMVEIAQKRALVWRPTDRDMQTG
jgi:NitT/TauT family transport system permease protein